ncbi:MAG: hypothetical protein FWE86_00505, partial [Oscillospiraceae bacterium]|nr:hypothetical protein [Oscillospiraceae bacterium]
MKNIKRINATGTWLLKATGTAKTIWGSIIMLCSIFVIVLSPEFTSLGIAGLVTSFFDLTMGIFGMRYASNHNKVVVSFLLAIVAALIPLALIVLDS